MPNLPAINPNTILLVAGAGGLGLAFLAGEGRVKKFATGSLVGFLFASQIGALAQAQLAKLSFVPDLSIGAVQIILLAVVALLFNLGKIHHVEGRPRVSVESIGLAVITAAFLFTAVLSFVGAETRKAITTDYNLAAMLYSWRLLLLGLTAGGLVVVEILGANTKKPK